MMTAVHLWYYVDEFLEWEMFQTNVLEKMKTHFIFNTFFSKNCAICEVMCENMVQPNRP
jgi:hypothetical protein